MVKQYKWKQIRPNIWKEVPPSECHECGHDEFSRILTKLLRSSIPKTKSYRVTEECTKCGL